MYIDDPSGEIWDQSKYCYSYKSSYEENRSERPRDRSGFNLSSESLQTNPIIRHCRRSII